MTIDQPKNVLHSRPHTSQLAHSLSIRFGQRFEDMGDLTDINHWELRRAFKETNIRVELQSVAVHVFSTLAL